MTACPDLQARGGWWEDRLSHRCSFPIAPVNTFSNLAYIAAGVVAAVLEPTWAGIAFGAAMTFLGIGSALYHGTKRVWASHLDNAGMYAAMAALAVYAAAPAHPLVAVGMTVFGGLCAWQLAWGKNWKVYLNPMMGVLVGAACTAVALNGSIVAVGTALGLLLAAYAIWWMDLKRTFWFPKLGHGLWHLITAGAMLRLFLGAK